MLLIDILISGLVLGGMYALVSMGLTLQYGVARIMNLAYGEFLVGAAFLAFWLYSALGVIETGVTLLDDQIGRAHF